MRRRAQRITGNSIPGGGTDASGDEHFEVAGHLNWSGLCVSVAAKARPDG